MTYSDLWTIQRVRTLLIQHCGTLSPYTLLVLPLRYSLWPLRYSLPLPYISHQASTLQLLGYTFFIIFRYFLLVFFPLKCRNHISQIAITENFQANTRFFSRKWLWTSNEKIKIFFSKKHLEKKFLRFSRNLKLGKFLR